MPLVPVAPVGPVIVAPVAPVAPFNANHPGGPVGPVGPVAPVSRSPSCTYYFTEIVVSTRNNTLPIITTIFFIVIKIHFFTSYL